MLDRAVLRGVHPNAQLKKLKTSCWELLGAAGNAWGCLGAESPRHWGRSTRVGLNTALGRINFVFYINLQNINYKFKYESLWLWGRTSMLRCAAIMQ
jgi:hypothetical protein